VSGTRIAAVGHTTSHAPHRTQSSGRGNHTTAPSPARHPVGHTATHRPHPVHRASSSTGNGGTDDTVHPSGTIA